MAENETLDLADGRNSGWARLGRLIASGVEPVRAGEVAGACLLHLSKRLLKMDSKWGCQQFPVKDLLEAVRSSDRKRVSAVLARCEGHEYAQLLAECRPADDSMQVAKEFLHRILDRFGDQYELHQTGEGRFSDFDSFAKFREEMQAAAAPEIDRIAAQIANNPDGPPRSAPKAKAKREAEHSAILRESLLKVGGTP